MKLPFGAYLQFSNPHAMFNQQNFQTLVIYSSSKCTIFQTSNQCGLIHRILKGIGVWPIPTWNWEQWLSLLLILCTNGKQMISNCSDKTSYPIPSQKLLKSQLLIVRIDMFVKSHVWWSNSKSLCSNLSRLNPSSVFGKNKKNRIKSQLVQKSPIISATNMQKTPKIHAAYLQLFPHLIRKLHQESALEACLHGRFPQKCWEHRPWIGNCSASHGWLPGNYETVFLFRVMIWLNEFRWMIIFSVIFRSGLTHEAWQIDHVTRHFEPNISAKQHNNRHGRDLGLARAK